MSEEKKEQTVSLSITDLADLVVDAQNMGYHLGVIDSMRLIAASLVKTSPELLENWIKSNKVRADEFIKKVTEKTSSDTKESLH